MKKYLKILMSVWLLFHLVIIWIFPNSLAYLNGTLAPIARPYTSLFGLTWAWSFYAPDPESARYFEYIVDFSEPSRETLTGVWPPPRNYFFDIRQPRLHTNMSFLVGKLADIRTTLIPWLCRQHSGASLVRVKYVIVMVPSIFDVRDGAPAFDPNNTRSETLASETCEPSPMVGGS